MSEAIFETIFHFRKLTNADLSTLVESVFEVGFVEVEVKKRFGNFLSNRQMDQEVFNNLEHFTKELLVELFCLTENIEGAMSILSHHFCDSYFAVYFKLKIVFFLS
jgi:hypothetical protein